MNRIKESIIGVVPIPCFVMYKFKYGYLGTQRKINLEVSAISQTGSRLITSITYRGRIHTCTRGVAG